MHGNTHQTTEQAGHQVSLCLLVLVTMTTYSVKMAALLLLHRAVDDAESKFLAIELW